MPTIVPERIGRSSRREARILVVDDEAAVLEAYRRVLNEVVLAPPCQVSGVAADLFAPIARPSTDEPAVVAVDLCRQGEEAVHRIARIKSDGGHCPIAFIDMRMPPGIDGLETAKRLRSQDPEINIVFVTGYSDRPPSEISRELGGADRLFYLVKPFDPDEVLQLISTLVVRWRSEQDVAASIVRVHSELVNLQKELARSEAESKDLREQVEQLRLQDSMAVRRHARDAEDAAENPVSSGVAPVVPRISTEAIRAAYSAGQAAYDRPDGLGLCPYSPIAETALFSAWVEGYRSREGPSSSRL